MKVKVGEGEGDKMIWDEGEVVAVVDNNMIRVRFVDDDGSTQEIDWNSPYIKWSSIADSRLPYTPVIASPGIDLWALGVMLFYCHSDGSPLLSVNRDDDLSSPADYHQAATWTKEEMNGKILALNTEPVAKDLLMKLLHPDPGERIQTMSELLNHAYFIGADADADTLKNIVAKIDEINAITKRIESNTIQLGDISVKTFELLRETRRVSKSFNIFLIS
jgi:serine/threonine protein kinase